MCRSSRSDRERPRPHRGPQRGSRAGVAGRAEDMEIRGEVSATARAGGGAPAPVKKVRHLSSSKTTSCRERADVPDFRNYRSRRRFPMKRLRDIGGVFVLAAAIFGPTLVAGQQPPAGQPPAGGFPDLVGALKATPGCLGVETARTASGKQVIFAWFENKKAVLNWYYSDTHMGVKNQFAPGSTHTPLADVPDEGEPVLAIASLTLTG